MIRRFSLYGFLKNQRYHEPFFVLALREQGLSFLDIGLLFGFRELCVNLLEIPSGAIADVYGRRRCMLLSLTAYVAAFVVFGLAPGLGLLYAAMALYAVGEAFRSGTHKAMIFTWLNDQGRGADKAEVYGYTRSWSKRGSAVAALIAAAIALVVGDFTTVFFCTAIPYALNVANLASYPRSLDGGASSKRPGALLRTVWQGLRAAWTIRALRRLLGESMAFEGGLKLTRTYLQPLIELWAVGLPLVAMIAAGGEGIDVAFTQTVVAAGLVYFVLGLVESGASRRAGRLAKRRGSSAAAVRSIFAVNLLCALALLAAVLAGLPAVAVVVFVIQLGALQNLFRPVQLARYDVHTPAQLGATVLSIESQARAVFVAVGAPLLGRAVDVLSARGGGVTALWPVAALGCAVAVILGSVARVREGDDAPPPAS
ncbi:MAG: MFS transporter [Myxococcales bacterium]|nr:MFS transporter [Myxococcales bacterium]